MRTYSSIRPLLLLLAFASPALAQFQPPTDEELKMTADPKAPGAAALYLYREETTDDTLHIHKYYERTKVLGEKGKELATIHIPYEHGDFQVTNIQGRTIHADGTAIPLKAKPEDLMEFKAAGRQMNEIVFTLPSVEVGSILEYRLEIRYSDNMVSSPDWELQQPYFVRKAHYSFEPASGVVITNSHGEFLDKLMYAHIGLTLQQIVRDPFGQYSVDLTDIPPLPSEDWMPPLNTLKWRVEFYYTYAHSGQEFWDAEGKRWAKDTARFTNPTGKLKSAVAQIVAPTDTEEQKARKIYAAVMALENTRFTRKKSEAERKAEKIKAIEDAEDVWNEKSGTDDEMALLFVAMARAAGLKVWPMKVVDRHRAIFDPNYLSVDQLDDYIAIVNIGGKEVYLDPGQKMCTFDQLHWKHQLATGIRLTENGATIATTPAGMLTASAEQRVAELEIDEKGNLKGVARFSMTGSLALHWRQTALENDPEEVRKQFNESIHDEVPEGIQADFDHFLALDDPNAKLIGVVKLSGNIGAATGKRMFLPGLFFESHAHHPFVAQDVRLTPVDVEYPKTVQDAVTYHLPSGFSVETVPPLTNITWASNAQLKIVSVAAADFVEVKRALAYNFTFVDPENYSDLHAFYQKVAAADQQQIVLTRTKTEKGN
jgi:hypothetical protein